MDIADLIRTGHFVYESGHHGDTWLDLDLLISQPRRLRTLAADLAERLAPLAPDLICGPLDGGAFLAQWIAADLGATFTYTRRDPTTRSVRYDLPDAVPVRGTRAAVVDDAINLGSAVIATTEALRAAGGDVIAVASVIACGPAGLGVGHRLGVPQLTLETVRTTVWAPGDCPGCPPRPASRPGEGQPAGEL